MKKILGILFIFTFLLLGSTKIIKAEDPIAIDYGPDMVADDSFFAEQGPEEDIGPAEQDIESNDGFSLSGASEEQNLKIIELLNKILELQELIITLESEARNNNALHPSVQERDNIRIADIKNLQNALALYYSDNNKYPKNYLALIAQLAPAYILSIPIDPLDNQKGCKSLIHDPDRATKNYTAGDFGYQYISTFNGQGYILRACLENENNVNLHTDYVTFNSPIFDVVVGD